MSQKKKYYPSQKSNNNRKSATYETNNQQAPLNENCSFYSAVGTNIYLGIDILHYYKIEELERMVCRPMENNKALRDLSLMLYGKNGIFRNTVDYLRALPSLNHVIINKGKSLAKKKNNTKLMELVLKSIRHKQFIRDALFKGMVEGVAFYYFETTTSPTQNKKFLNDFEAQTITEINDINEFGINAHIISLPTDYTQIVWTKNSSYVICFNLNYFQMNDSVSLEQKLKQFPEEIRNAYYEWQKNKFKTSNWVVLDNTKTIVHKIGSKREEKWGRPIVLAAINDILYGDYFTKTKRNVLDEINNQLIYQVFPEGKEKGTPALTKEQQQRQHETVKNAVVRKNNKGGTSFFSVTAGTKIDSIKVANTEIFDAKNEKNLNDEIALYLGIAASLLNGVGSGSYSAQQLNLKLISAQLFEWVEEIETELNKCISANIIKDNNNTVECRYIPLTSINSPETVTNYKDLYLQGCGSLTYWILACGEDPEVYLAKLDEEIESGMYEKYRPHLTSYTLSSNDKKAGRPQTDNPTENTIASRANNGNSLPTPSDT